MHGKIMTMLTADGTALEIDIRGEESVLEAIRRLDPSALDAPCGGAGTCGKCRIRVLSGHAGHATDEEKDLLGEEAIKAGCRLACRVQAGPGLKVSPTKTHGNAVIRESFASLRGTPDPLHRKAGTYGVAVDVGTTTVAAYLVDFAEAAVVASASCLNRQRAFGADVIARIDYAGKGAQYLNELAALIRADVDSLIAKLREKSGAPIDSILEISVVGNTTMQHLFAGVDPAPIAVAPFTPVFVELREGPAEEYGLPYPKARLTLAPSIAGYVGADITAGIRAVHLEGRKGLCLLLDLGTNGEMALGNADRILTCATAAGPAFEGAAISCGLGGISGAIDSVRWEGGKLKWTTIGGEKPIGICGSGIIDAAACLLHGGFVDETGALADEYAEAGVPIAAEGEKPILFTQGDVRQIQLAKAAVAAGIATMLDAWGATTADIDKVFLAGGFGSYLRPESAAAIGLIPAELLERIEGVGNAAGHGAVRMLLFKDERQAQTELTRNCAYIELSDSAYFRDRFIEEMFFPVPEAVQA